jgi:hypothetical protein
VERKTMKASIAPMTSCVVIVVSLAWLPPKIAISLTQREILKAKSEKNITYSEPRRFVCNE